MECDTVHTRVLAPKVQARKFMQHSMKILSNSAGVLVKIRKHLDVMLIQDPPGFVLNFNAA